MSDQREENYKDQGFGLIGHLFKDTEFFYIIKAKAEPRYLGTRNLGEAIKRAREIDKNFTNEYTKKDREDRDISNSGEGSAK